LLASPALLALSSSPRATIIPRSVWSGERRFLAFILARSCLYEKHPVGGRLQTPLRSVNEEEVETPTRIAKTVNATKDNSRVKKTTAGGVGINITSPSAVGDNAQNQPGPEETRTLKTPVSGVLVGRVLKPEAAVSGADLKCPAKGCSRTFSGKNTRQSLWHHVKYYACTEPTKTPFTRAPAIATRTTQMLATPSLIAELVPPRPFHLHSCQSDGSPEIVELTFGMGCMSTGLSAFRPLSGDGSID
jgi:hypothetical protein